MESYPFINTKVCLHISESNTGKWRLPCSWYCSIAKEKKKSLKKRKKLDTVLCELWGPTSWVCILARNFSGDLVNKGICPQSREDTGVSQRSGWIPGGRKWRPTQTFLPGIHGQRSRNWVTVHGGSIVVYHWVSKTTIVLNFVKVN